MEIVCIFEDYLFSVKYDNESSDEFARLFNLWADPEYLEEFFEANKKDLQSGYFGNISIEDAINSTIQYAQKFEDSLLEVKSKKNLNDIFVPLTDTQTQITTLNESKAKQSWLRIYALRVDKDTYIVTGGAIKLTHAMQGATHTHRELEKIKFCRSFLISKGIIDKDGVIDVVEIKLP